MIPFLLNLAGAAALLLWAVRIIRTGIERAFAAQLRKWLRRSAGKPLLAAGTGTFTAVLLQSSTAVALLVADFVAKGTIGTAVGLAIILGADVGSAIITQILLLRAEWLVPLLLVTGVAMFLRGRRRPVRQGGRILTGLALVLISLDMIRAATAPLRSNDAIAPLAAYLGDDLISAFLLGAVLAWAMHSSVAAVLMFVTFVAEGVLSAPAGMSLVLGANLGGAVIPFLLTLSAPPAARTVVLANLVLRGGGALIALALLSGMIGSAQWGFLGATPARQTINLHLAYNLIVALAGLPLIGPLTNLLARLLEKPGTASVTIERLSALDPEVLDQPARALACANREVLRIGETIETMLASVMPLYDNWDDAVATAIREREREVNRMYFDTKLYLARLNQQELPEDQAQRSMELSSTAASFESAGDLIAKNLLNMAGKRKERGISFSPEGWRDLCDFHDRVLSNMQLALNVLMTGSIEAARQLVEEKDLIRDLEQKLQHRHMERLRSGRAESIESSNIHQETLRALKQVNAAFTIVAYPILTRAGELLTTRLANDPDEEHG